MANRHEDQLPPDLADIAAQLRAERPTATPLELDRIKLQAKSQRARGAGTLFPRMKGTPMRSRAVTLILTVLLIGGTTAGGLAAAGGGHNGSSSAGDQYRPGKGCGDKNHQHTGPPGNPSNNKCPH